jgi:hypothetical protein
MEVKKKGEKEGEEEGRRRVRSGERRERENKRGSPKFPRHYTKSFCAFYI